MAPPVAPEKRVPFFWHGDPIGCYPSFLSVNSTEPVAHAASRDPRSYEEMGRVFHATLAQPTAEGLSMRWRGSVDPLQRPAFVLDLSAHANVPFGALSTAARGGISTKGGAKAFLDALAVGLDTDGKKIMLPRIGFLNKALGGGAAWLGMDKCSLTLGYAPKDTEGSSPRPAIARTLDSVALRVNHVDSTVSLSLATLLPVGLNHMGPEWLRGMGLGEGLGVWSAGALVQWRAPWKAGPDPAVPRAVQWRVRGSFGGRASGNGGGGGGAASAGSSAGAGLVPLSSLLVQGDDAGSLGIHALTHLTRDITLGTSHTFGGRDGGKGSSSLLGKGTRVGLLVTLPEGNPLDLNAWRRAAKGSQGLTPTATQDAWTRAASEGRAEPTYDSLRRMGPSGAVDGHVPTVDNANGRRPYLRITSGCGESALTVVVPVGNKSTSVGGTVRLLDDGDVKVGIAITSETYARR